MTKIQQIRGFFIRIHYTNLYLTFYNNFTDYKSIPQILIFLAVKKDWVNSLMLTVTWLPSDVYKTIIFLGFP